MATPSASAACLPGRCAGGNAATVTIPGGQGGHLWLLAEQPAQRVQQGTELVSAGQELAIAARGPQAGMGAGRGDHDLRVRALEPLPAQYRLIQVAADHAQPRP